MSGPGFGALDRLPDYKLDPPDVPDCICPDDLPCCGCGGTKSACACPLPGDLSLEANEALDDLEHEDNDF